MLSTEVFDFSDADFTKGRLFESDDTSMSANYDHYLPYLDKVLKARLCDLIQCEIDSLSGTQTSQHRCYYILVLAFVKSALFLLQHYLHTVLKHLLHWC